MSAASLPPGTRLGVYEVIAPIGAGGMGEVYQARDTKLNRTVALKILPAALAADADRLARFRREAQVLASLNHPNIAIIHGVEDAAEPHALVMEFVPGRTLAEAVTGPLPVVEALTITRHIASALEAAHEQGIVHRDLKPANVKVTDAGTVKVLDFGLAKDTSEAARSPLSGASLATAAPTMTSPAMTEMGVILGTAGYMAPEQAKGRPVDRRADIWALGVVLYEMLTGARLYAGETVTETIAHVITQPPDWSKLPADTPAPVRRMLRRMLEKDPRNRLQSAGDVRIEIDEYLAAPALADADAREPASVPAFLRVFPWALAAALLVALAVAAWPRAVTPPAPLRFEMLVADKASLVIDEAIDGSIVALSPDGQHLVYIGADEKGRRLYLRSLSALESMPLSNTEGSIHPTFSPDSTELAFFSNGALRRMPITGGMPVVVTNVVDPRGLAWAADGTMVFAPDISAGLHRVPASGGDSAPITTLEPNERTHRWPHFLPGGKAVLFMVQRQDGSYDDGTIEAVTLATGERKVLVRGGTYPMFVEPGYLLYARQNTVFAVAFDAERLEVQGNPQPVLTGVFTSSSGVGGGTTNGGAQIAVANGRAMYLAGSGSDPDGLELVILDRNGEAVYTFPSRRPFRDVRFLPDGRRVGVRISDARSEQLHTLDPVRGTLTQFTFEGTSSGTPVWSRDGARLAFLNNREGNVGRIYVSGAEAAGEATALTTDDVLRVPSDFTPDGRLLATEFNPRTLGDIVAIDLATKAITPVLSTPAAELLPSLSPDGRWLTYMADPDGGMAVFVRAFPGGGGLRKVSPQEGGLIPYWTKDGREIVFVGTSLETSTFYAVEMTEKNGVLEAGIPRKLFTFPAMQPGNAVWYHVSSDGNRFAMFRGQAEVSVPIRRNATVVFDFTSEIKKALGR